MLSTKTSAYLELIRPVNFLITFFTGIVAVIICLNENFSTKIAFFVGLSAAFTAVAGNIINDIFDIEIDKVNRPDRPLPSGKLSNKGALVLYFIYLLLSLILSWFINLPAFIIVAVTNYLLYLYSEYLKRIPLVGNILVALLTGLVFIYGGVAVEKTSAAIIPAIFAFLVNLIREIIKDMQDVEGDKKVGYKTFPIKFGFNKSIQLILILSIVLILATCYPYITQVYRIEYFIIVMVIVNPVIVYSTKSLFEDRSNKNLKKISNLLKLSMVLGLIAIYFG